MPRKSDPWEFGDDERELLKERIVEMRMMGETPAQIAATLTAEGREVSWQTVQRYIREAAEESAARLAQTIDQRRMEQDRRVEYLLSICMKVLREKYANGLSIDKDMRNAVSLFERQARLLGLDVVRNQGQGSRLDWIDSAPLQDVMTEAERLGLIQPGEFQTPSAF